LPSSPDREPEPGSDRAQSANDRPQPASGVEPTGEDSPAESLSVLHQAFDQLYPVIRFSYERLGGQVWFSEIRPQLWLGGAPTYDRDLEDLLRLEIRAIVDMRAEREAHED